MSEFVKEVTATELKALIASGKPVVCDFWATWCGPCRMLAPVMDEVAKTMQGKVEFVKVDIDKEEELAVEQRIFSVPCVKLFVGGEMKAETVGFQPEDSIRQFVEGNL